MRVLRAFSPLACLAVFFVGATTDFACDFGFLDGVSVVESALRFMVADLVLGLSSSSAQ
jgi:hypothetical protein